MDHEGGIGVHVASGVFVRDRDRKGVNVAVLRHFDVWLSRELDYRGTGRWRWTCLQIVGKWRTARLSEVRD